MKPRHLALVLAVLLTATTVLAAVAVSRVTDLAPTRTAASPAAAVPVTSDVRALAVLRAWDARRARAWARGDVAGLGALYAPGSRTGAEDSRMLRSYVDRGLRVTGIRMQVLEAEVLAGRPGRLLLRVTDRLAGAVARRGGRSVVLPRDLPSTRLVRLRRLSGEWLVAEVRDQARAAASTACTSGCRNR